EDLDHGSVDALRPLLEWDVREDARARRADPDHPLRPSVEHGEVERSFAIGILVARLDTRPALPSRAEEVAARGGPLLLGAVGHEAVVEEEVGRPRACRPASLVAGLGVHRGAERGCDVAVEAP